MGVGWAVGMVVGGEVGVCVGAGAVHPLMQSIRMRAVVISPYTSSFMQRNMKYRYIILLMKGYHGHCPEDITINKRLPAFW
jgi:hypothetical protein